MKKSHQWKITLGVAFIFLALGCSREPGQPTEPGTRIAPRQAPLINAAPGEKVVPSSYVVVFKDSVTDVDAKVDSLMAPTRSTSDFRYRHALKGFAASLSPSDVARLQLDPGVAYIQQNAVMSISATQPNPPTWGLDRVDERALPLDGVYTYNGSGTGVDAYIIDTGIRTTHTDFGGRATAGFDAIGSGAIDGHGHGTHVAGTAGGTTYGIAKGVNLIAVRVLDAGGSGSTAEVVAGVDWVTAHHTNHPAVANMSLGGPVQPALDQAVQNSIADGVVYCIAAGNDGVDASNVSPARVPEAITVGATTGLDNWAWFSNYGSIVDILAPGVAITSAWNTSDVASSTIDGTSMACPHVAGVVALYLEANPTATPAQVATALSSVATADAIYFVPAGTVNRLVYSLVGAGVTAPAAPVLTSPANGAMGVDVNPTLAWRASAGAQTYEVQVSSNSGFTALVADQTGLTATSTTVGGLAAVKRFYWRVNATNAMGTSPWSAVRHFTTGTGAPTPTTPGQMLPANESTVRTLTPTLSWIASPGAMFYHVQISTRSSFRTLVWDRSGITATSVPTPRLADRTLYYWRVCAMNPSGASEYSPIQTFRIRR